MKVLIAAIAMMILVACGTDTPKNYAGQGYTIETWDKVWHFHDDDRGVTCWIVALNTNVGIDCIPDRDFR